MTGDDEHADQVVRALIGIGAELAAIRQELERLNADASEPDEAADAETFTCRSCGAGVAGEERAKHHAETEHGAPPGAWRDLYADA